ncbi:MAG: cyclase family protein [Microcystis aeruginosa Ma_OC_H_19870700_S124]|uniref:Kynurenine formamidase n=1 Tax=Microcystis aeruginosa Ma_OC_H_19870700_S124 TaxID=2486262 RepID=A0A552AF65_MICAE|nr:cyclase family protein [Burkholderiales bacterium]TRT84100.1 MAG: cyclase family protein [Microcystis aeruginosa Ma_OC_H_19870700_S124]
MRKYTDKYIDISVPVSSKLPIWPGSPEIKFERNLDLDQGDIANDTTIRFSVHTGTHVDAPLHFVAGGNSVDKLPLDVLIGRSFVVDVEDADVISAEMLDKLGLPSGVERLLIRTRNSALWGQVAEFRPDFVALTADAAQWVVERGIRLIGVDYLSVQRFQDGPETHIILLKSEVVIIEGLNLTNVTPGEYKLICLPLKLEGVEGAPARVVLESLSPA